MKKVLKLFWPLFLMALPLGFWGMKPNDPGNPNYGKPACNTMKPEWEKFTFTPLSLSYKTDNLEGNEQNTMMVYHGPSPITSLGGLFNSSTDMLDIQQRSSLEVNHTHANCTGSFNYVANKSSDIQGLALLKFPFFANYISSRKIEIKSVVLQPYDMNIIWAGQLQGNSLSGALSLSGVYQKRTSVRESGDTGSTGSSGGGTNYTYRNGPLYYMDDSLRDLTPAGQTFVKEETYMEAISIRDIEDKDYTLVEVDNPSLSGRKIYVGEEFRLDKEWNAPVLLILED